MNFRFFHFLRQILHFLCDFFFDEILSGFRDKFQKRVAWRVTCVAFSIKFAETNQKFAEKINSEFCEKNSLFLVNYSLRSLPMPPIGLAIGLPCMPRDPGLAPKASISAFIWFNAAIASCPPCAPCPPWVSPACTPTAVIGPRARAELSAASWKRSKQRLHFAVYLSSAQKTLSVHQKKTGLIRICTVILNTIINSK